MTTTTPWTMAVTKVFAFSLFLAFQCVFSLLENGRLPTKSKTRFFTIRNCKQFFLLFLFKETVSRPFASVIIQSLRSKNIFFRKQFYISRAIIDYPGLTYFFPFAVVFIHFSRKIDKGGKHRKTILTSYFLQNKITQKFFENIK